MTERTLVGHYPTPWGMSIPMYRWADDPDPERLWTDLDGTLTMVGIYSERDRARCKDAYQAAVSNDRIPFEFFLEHGGRKPPKVPLPRPHKPVYPTLPRGFDMDIPIENWVTLVLDVSSWSKRADALLEVIDSNVTAAGQWSAPPEVIAIGLQHLLTASLEHLPDTEIDCLEGAALYVLSLHDEWIAAGTEWLRPVARTWLSDWIGRHKGCRRFARLCRKANPELPTWIVGGAA